MRDRRYYEKILNNAVLLIISLIYSAFGFEAFQKSFVSLKYTTDSVCFSLVARGMLNGKMPYVDYVDNKGPITYLLYIFPNLFGEKYYYLIGITELIILFFISLYFIKKTCDVFKVKNGFFVTVLYSALLLGYNGWLGIAGGSSEELALPFIWISIYLWARYINSENKYKSADWYYGFLLGILFSFTFLIRINNMLSIALIILHISVMLIINKQPKLLFKCASFFLLGCLVVFIPIIIYLAVTGMLNEFLKLTLFMNIRSYSNTKTGLFLAGISSDYGLIAISIFVFSLIFSLFSIKNKKGKNSGAEIFIIIASFVNILVNLSAANRFYHYLVTSLPFFVLSLILFLTGGDKKQIPVKKVIAFIILVLHITVMSVSVNVGATAYAQAANRVSVLCRELINKEPLYSEDYINDCKDIASRIPADSKDKVTGLFENLNFYTVTGILPNERILIAAPWYISKSEELKKGYYSRIENKEYDYYVYERNYEINPEIKKIYDDYFVEVYRNNTFVLCALR